MGSFWDREVSVMRRFIILLLPLLIGCSFQVRESEGDEERLSRRPAVEDRDVYSEFDFRSGFKPYELERRVPLVDYSTDDVERLSRESAFFEDIDAELNYNDMYEPYDIYREDQLNYNGRDERIEFLEVEKGEEENLRLDIFK